jgi:outer membrane protein OmpA-like peptidoglycan-associated protein
MRFEALLAASLIAGCAVPDTKHVCHPVTSWATPAYECAAIYVPPPAPPPPPPLSVEAPPARPERRVKVSDDKLELAETVQFDSDKDTILDKSKTLLDEVVALIEEHPELTKIQIEGYTDSTSSKAHNQKLSLARANAVKKYLTEHGIDGAMLTTKGFGQDNPVADNKAEDGRFQNRRVDFRILARKPAE